MNCRSSKSDISIHAFPLLGRALISHNKSNAMRKDRRRSTMVWIFAIEKRVVASRGKPHHMSGRPLAVAFLLCISVLHPSHNAIAQKVKVSFDKSADFTKYKK